MDVKQLRAHALGLASAFNVMLVFVPDCERHEACSTLVYQRRVVLARGIDDETSYAVVLHELGHVLSAWGMLRTAKTLDNWNLVIEEERAAWDWARHYALEWTVAMASVERYAMSTYGQNC